MKDSCFTKVHMRVSRYGKQPCGRKAHVLSLAVGATSAGCVPTALRLRAAPLSDADAAAWKPGECPVCLDVVADSGRWLRFVCGHGTCRECLYSLAHSRCGAVLHAVQRRHVCPIRQCRRAAIVYHPTVIAYRWCGAHRLLCVSQASGCMLPAVQAAAGGRSDAAARRWRR